MEHKLLNHSSRAVTHLFLTEMWERFSYYGVSALLILYLSHEWQLPDAQTYTLYGAYGTLVYASAVFGGLLSDHYLGPYRAVLIGGWLLMIGHFVLLLPSEEHIVFYSGLALIILGTGLFKPSVQALVASLYEGNNNQREQGFVLTYIGSNLGTVLAPILSSIVALYYGWHLAFGLAGLGMLLGLINFRLAKPYFSDQISRSIPRSYIVPFMWMTCVLIGFVYLLQHASWVGYGLVVVVITTISLLIKVIYQASPRVKKAMQQALMLLCFYIVFMVLLQQSGGALNLFTDRFVNKHVLGWVVPTGMFQSVEPLALIGLSSLFLLWKKTRNNVAPVSYTKYFIRALSLMGASFFVLVIGIKISSQQASLAMIWLNTTYLLQAAGEVFIGPIGLAMLSEYIPRKHLGLFMGTWVLASALANFIAAQIGSLTAIPSLQALTDVSNQYIQVYSLMGALGIVAACLLNYWGKQKNFLV